MAKPLGTEVRFNAGSFMCAAATHGDRDKLEWAISSKQGREALEFQNNSGHTPLLIACSKGHLECVRLLLENGAKLEVTNKKGDTCLSLAEKNGHERTISFIRTSLDELKKYGSCLAKLKGELIALCSKQDTSAEEITRLDELVGIFKLATGKNEELFDGEPLVIRACKADNEQLVNHLVDKLNMTYIANDTEGRTILHIAVMNKFKMRYALTKRFPELLSTIDMHGQTSFHAACVNNDMEYIKWLFDLVLKEKSQKPSTPPSTPMVMAGTCAPPLPITYAPRDAIVEEEDSANSTGTSTGSLVSPPQEEIESGLGVTNFSSPATEFPPRGIPASLSSSDIKLVMNLQHAFPTGPLFPVTYHQYVEKMKLFAVDTKGRNVFHVMVKKDYHELMAYILELWPKLGVRGPITRDFWLRAEDMENPLDEAITQQRHQCLDVMLNSIVSQCDPARFEDDDSLLLKAVCSRCTEVIKVLIQHGAHNGLDKALCVAVGTDFLPLLLFYKEVIGLIKSGEDYLMDNTLNWRDYLLRNVEPIWVQLAAHAVDLVKELFTDDNWDTKHSLFMAAGKAVITQYDKLISKPITSPIGECFTTVILSENELTSVPIELLSLPNLIELDLSNNCIEELPSGTLDEMSYSCHSLKTLTINHNVLTTLPGKLFLLPELEVVSAHHNKIKELPTTAWISISLLTLNLAHNKLSRLHDLSGSQLFQNQEEESFQPDQSTRSNTGTKSKLDLFVAQLNYRDILKRRRKPSNADSLVEESLETIDCTGTNLTYDDDSALLCCLKLLDLSSNSFTKMPSDLPCLAPKLEKVWLNYNSIDEVDLMRDFPADLSILYMQSCELKDISVTRSESIPCGDVLHLLYSPEEGGYCEHCTHEYLAILNTLSLRNNNISCLEVAKKMSDTYQALFPVLSVLDVSNNQLSKVPDHLELLTELSSLNLSNNNISSLPSSISKLNQLWVINVENLTLSNIPRATLSSHSATELKNYLKHLHQNSHSYRRMKLMFVGESNKGKTSLLLALTKKGRVNHYQEVKLNINRKPLSTVGVDLGDWEYAKPTGLLYGGARKITFMTWDFGGQEEYYATHQCFLSPHALYVLVWNVLDGEAGLVSLRPWLENIESRAMGAQVIVVGTHVDLWDVQSKRRIIEEFLTNKFRALYIDCDRRQRRTYPKIAEKIYFVDTNNKDHINRLRDVIYDYASEYRPSLSGKKNPIPLLEELVPASYVSLEETVRQIAAQLRSDGQAPILTHQEFTDQVSNMAEGVKMTQAELKQATHFLHEKGILLHYDEGRLSDLYFVDPQWLCSMLAKVIAVPEVNAFHKNGFISRVELGRIFGPRSHVNECINLMQKFEVLFELDNSRYLIPSLLPPSESQSCVVFPRSLKIRDPRSADKLSGPAFPLGSHSNCLVRFFMLPFIPNGMLPRLSARLIATDVIEHVLSLLKITSFADDQHYINRPHWRVWRYGITLVYRHMQIFRIVPMDIPLPGVDVVHVIQPKELLQSASHHNVYKGVSIMVQVDNLPDNAFNEKGSGLQMATWLLQQAVEQINSVFEDWYEEFAWKRSIDLSVVAADPCPQCMSVVYEQLAPDQYAAQKRLVDEPRAMEQAKKDKKISSFLRTMTLSRPSPNKINRSTSEIPDVSYSTMKRSAASPFPSWSSGRLYGHNEKVVYLFSVKLSALSVMESTPLTCPTHGAISIDQIAPDMIFADLALNMRVKSDDVTQKHYLDEGGFGCIYLATVKLQGGVTKEVAVKTFTILDGNPSNYTKGEIAWHHYQSANAEGRIMASLHHANILPIVGIVFQPIRLLLEFAPLGSLKNIVNRYHDNNSRIGRYALQKVISQLSSAMEYLHCNKIIYRDIKPGNVLVWRFPEPHLPWQHCDVEIKLADYGISKQVVPWGIRGMLGTPPYLPPEVILHGGKQVYTFKIDVYSFGMLLFYLFTFTKPFGKICRPLRAYLEAELRPEMLLKHRPSCQMMYELMCWCWSSKPHHRPSFSMIRQLAHHSSFTRLHHVMSVQPRGNIVTSAVMRYYKIIGAHSNERQRHKSLNLTPGHSYKKHRPVTDMRSLQQLTASINPALSAETEATEIWYGTTDGVMGVVDMQQSSASSQVVDSMKSPISCMILLEGNVWVGSPSGVVKLYNAVSKLPIGHWNSKLCITEMVHLPNGYYDDDKQALLVLAKPSSIVVFTQLDRQSSKLIDTIVPDHIIKLHGDPICALLMPTLHQLWVCTTDNQLNVFCTGCYDNLPMKCANPHGACCMATEKDCVLIASGSAVHKWSPCQSPTCVTSLNCEATIMEKIPNYEVAGCLIKTMIGHHGDVYVGTQGGAILVMDVTKMTASGVLHLQDSPVNCFLLLKQFNRPKVTTLKRKTALVTITHSLHHEPEDDILLVNFALRYHGISQYSESHPSSYNYPQMTSLGRYQQPVVNPDSDELHMLLWSAHNWTI